MQTTSIDVKPNANGEVFTATGVIQFTVDEVTAIARRSGQPGMFDSRVQTAILEHLRQHPTVPKTHDILACSVRLEAFTNLTVWEFSAVGVSRFSA